MKKCSKRTHELLKEERSKIMKETKEYLKSLRLALEPKKKVA